MLRKEPYLLLTVSTRINLSVHVVTPFAMDLVRADEDCRLTSAGICWSFHGKSAVKNIYEDIVVDDGDMERHLSPIYYCINYTF